MKLTKKITRYADITIRILHLKCFPTDGSAPFIVKVEDQVFGMGESGWDDPYAFVDRKNVKREMLRILDRGATRTFADGTTEAYTISHIEHVDTTTYDRHLEKEVTYLWPFYLNKPDRVGIYVRGQELP